MNEVNYKFHLSKFYSYMIIKKEFLYFVNEEYYVLTLIIHNIICIICVINGITYVRNIIF